MLIILIKNRALQIFLNLYLLSLQPRILVLNNEWNDRIRKSHNYSLALFTMFYSTQQSQNADTVTNMIVNSVR